MKITRREFLILTAGFAAAGCHSTAGNPVAHEAETINAGPAAQYALDGVYSKFRNRGFFIVRQGEKLLALSSICTHSYCKLIAEPDRSFYCKCHGSTFDPSGKVTHGPAKRNLPAFPTTVNEMGEVLVKVLAT